MSQQTYPAAGAAALRPHPRRWGACALLAVLLVTTAAAPAWSQFSFHLDVAVRAEGSQLFAEFCGSPELGCDSLPVLELLGLDPGQLPTDGLTGHPIFISDFGDFAGGPFSTDDPGFQALAGWLPPDVLLSYEAMGTLSYWDPEQGRWRSEVENDTRVRLFGGLPPDAISTDPEQCSGLPICLIGDIGSTVFTVAGIEDYTSLIIDNTSAAGGLHAHLDWFLESPDGVGGGPTGAYLVTLRVVAPGFLPSTPFMVMLNNGLEAEEFAAALRARFAYSVSTTSGTGGSLVPESTEVAHGTVATFSVNALEGYSIEAVSGCDGTLSGDVFTTAPVTADCTVDASFTRNRYEVTASAGTGGRVSPVVEFVAHGETAAFTLEVAPGYDIGSVNGCSGALDGTLFVTGRVTAPCAVVASFVPEPPPTYTATAVSGPGGLIEPSAVSVAEGEAASFSVAPQAGYRIAGVSGCAGTLNGSVYSTGALTADCTVSASFTPIQYEVTASAGAGGRVTPAVVLVAHGDTAAFTVESAEGYGIGSVNGCGGVLTGSVFVTGAISASCAVVASFVQDEPPPTYTATAIAGPGGRIEPGALSVAEGETASFSVAPQAGYRIAEVSGCAGTLNGSVYATGALTADCIVSASFAPIEYDLTASAGAGGRVTPAAVRVAHGESAAFTLEAAPGYNIDSVSGCGGTLTGTVFVTGAIAAPCAVVASFVEEEPPPTHTATAVSGPGGLIEPGALSVAEGDTANFSVTPQVGYRIAEVAGCAGTLNGSVYSTGALTADCTVSASFAPIEYEVTATASAGGSITPPSLLVEHGARAVFTVSPDPDNAVADIAGCGGVLSGSLFTTGEISRSCTVVVTFESAKPTFSPDEPVPLDINATGLFTELPADVAPIATDHTGAALDVSLLGASTRFSSGKHSLRWVAVDGEGAVATVDQELRVHPIISLGPGVEVGFAPGGRAEFSVELSGPSPLEEVTVPYEVAGHLHGHDLRSGSVTLTPGETSKSISFAVTEGASPGVPDQEIMVTLGDVENRGSRDRLRVILRSTNSAPVVAIRGSQNGQVKPRYARSAGPLALRPTIADPDTLDEHTVQWQTPPGVSTRVEGDALIVDPQSLSVGVHFFEVLVTDDGVPPQMGRGSIYIALTDEAVALPAGAEEWANSGLPAHADYLPETGNTLPVYARELSAYLLEADPGARLSLGAYAALSGSHQAALENSVAVVSDDSVANVGPYVDFVVERFGTPGSVVSIVVPQTSPVPTDPVFRRFNPVSGSWQDFLERGVDRLASSPGSAGYCPPPGAEVYTPGLTSGDWCVQLTIEDGGANDGDGQVNAKAAVTGGVGAVVQTVVVERPPSGGAGSLGLVTLACLCFRLLWARRRLWSGTA